MAETHKTRLVLGKIITWQWFGESLVAENITSLRSNPSSMGIANAYIYLIHTFTISKHCYSRLDGLFTILVVFLDIYIYNFKITYDFEILLFTI